MALQLVFCATGRSALMLDVPQHTAKPKEVICQAGTGDKLLIGIDMRLFIVAQHKPSSTLSLLLPASCFMPYLYHRSHASVTHALLSQTRAAAQLTSTMPRRKLLQSRSRQRPGQEHALPACATGSWPKPS